MTATSLREWRAAGRFFEHRGHSIFHRVEDGRGTEPPLLLIHGFPTSSWDWHRVWPEVRARFSRVVAADMIGFGFSAKPRRWRYSIFDQADLHESLLRELGIARYHVLAHDYGDTVAQELLARRIDGGARPELLSVVFLNGGLFPESHRPRPIQRLLASRLGFVVARMTSERSFARSFAAIFGRDTKPTASEMRELWELVTTNDGLAVFPKLIGYMDERKRNRSRWVGALERSPIPLRVIDGAADPVSGAHMVARYRELVPGADAVLLDGVGHYPQIEAPRAVLDAFEAFHVALKAR